MGLINIAIVSEDKEYSKALAWAMVRNTKGIEIWVVDDPDNFDADTSFDVLLTDIASGPHLGMSKVVAYLAESRADLRSMENTNVIYKYGNVRGICRRLFEICGFDPDAVISGHAKGDAESGKELYCFAAERGGSGCSFAGMSFSEELGKYYGRKVLFFSLDQFPDPVHVMGEGGGVNRAECSSGDPLSEKRADSYADGFVITGYDAHFGEGMGRDGAFSEGAEKSGDVSYGSTEMGAGDKRNGRTLKQYLYYLLKNGKGADMSQYLLCDENNVFCFRQDDGLNPLLELDEKEFGVFLRVVMEYEAFDTIVADCGSQVTMQMIRTMEMSKRVFLVKDDRPLCAGWRNCVGRLTGEAARAKIVLLPRDKASDADWIMNL